MKKLFKILGYLVLILLIVIGGLITYVKVALPNVGEAPNLTIERTPERIERGKYLANNVSMCINCHSERDWTKFAGPVVPGTEGEGGELFDQKVGMPGAYYSKNLTPEGMSKYTDGELFRAITAGVNKEGKALFPLMPYNHYGTMDPEDIYSIIAYLRTLSPIKKDIPESVSDFPMSVILNTIPKKPTPGKRPDPSSKDYPAYMVNASGCIECHTRENHGQIIPELAFSGGREFKMPDGAILRTPNITPNKTTGIGAWTEEMFIRKFKSYADSGYVAATIAPGQYNTLMPWTSYCGMTNEDLAAIYKYLMALPAQQNTVVRFTPAAEVAKK
jgi:cytochrome c2